MKESIKLLKLLTIFIVIGIISGVLFTSAITVLVLVSNQGETLLTESVYEGYLSSQQSFAKNLIESWKVTLGVGLLFGFGFYFFMGIPLYLIKGRVLGLQHKRDIVIPYPYAQSFALCISSLRLISKYRIKRKDVTKGKITAKIGVSRNSPFNTIHFRLHKINENKTGVQIINRGIPGIIGPENLEKIVPFLTSSRKIPSQHL